jgi:hypothetical protein
MTPASQCETPRFGGRACAGKLQGMVQQGSDNRGFAPIPAAVVVALGMRLPVGFKIERIEILGDHALVAAMRFQILVQVAQRHCEEGASLRVTLAINARGGGGKAPRRLPTACGPLRGFLAMPRCWRIQVPSFGQQGQTDHDPKVQRATRKQPAAGQFVEASLLLRLAQR